MCKSLILIIDPPFWNKFGRFSEKVPWKVFNFDGTLATPGKNKADLLDKNKMTESQGSEHTRTNFRQYPNDISKKK